MIRLAETIGARTVGTTAEIYSYFSFVLRCLKGLATGSYLTNRAVYDVLVMQIFFTAYQLLPLFILLSVVYGTLFIGIVLYTVKSFGLVHFLGEIVMGIVVLEMAPIITVFLLATRSSSAMNAEMAVMKVNRELAALESFRIDPIIYLFVPRIISFILSVTILSALFSIIVLFSGFVFSAAMFNMGPEMYAGLIARAVTVSDLVIMLVKSVTFGFLISVTPIYHGWKTSGQMTAIPVSVLKGMMTVFMLILLVEGLSLAARLAFSSL